MNTTEKVKSPLELLFFDWNDQNGDTPETDVLYENFCNADEVGFNEADKRFDMIAAGIRAAQHTAFMAGFKIATELFSGGKA